MKLYIFICTCVQRKNKYTFSNYTLSNVKTLFALLVTHKEKRPFRMPVNLKKPEFMPAGVRDSCVLRYVYMLSTWHHCLKIQWARRLWDTVSTYHSRLAWVTDLNCLEYCVFYNIKVDRAHGLTFKDSLGAYFRDLLLVLKNIFNCLFFKHLRGY